MTETIYHNHHIIPRHAGGTNDPSNLVRITVHEHALAHKKLWEEHGRVEDKAAWEMLSGQVLFGLDTLREIYRKGGLMSIGRTHSDITRDKMSKSALALKRKRPDLARFNRGMLGKKRKPQSAEWIAKRAEAQRQYFQTPAGIAHRKAISDRMKKNNPTKMQKNA